MGGSAWRRPNGKGYVPKGTCCTWCSKRFHPTLLPPAKDNPDFCRECTQKLKYIADGNSLPRQEA